MFFVVYFMFFIVFFMFSVVICFQVQIPHGSNISISLLIILRRNVFALNLQTEKNTLIQTTQGKKTTKWKRFFNLSSEYKMLPSTNVTNVICWEWNKNLWCLISCWVVCQFVHEETGNIRIKHSVSLCFLHVSDFFTYLQSLNWQVSNQSED